MVFSTKKNIIILTFLITDEDWISFFTGSNEIIYVTAINVVKSDPNDLLSDMKQELSQFKSDQLFCSHISSSDFRFYLNYLCRCAFKIDGDQAKDIVKKITKNAMFIQCSKRKRSFTLPVQYAESTIHEICERQVCGPRYIKFCMNSKEFFKKYFPIIVKNYCEENNIDIPKQIEIPKEYTIEKRNMKRKYYQ
jgi:hypothetical protein